MSTRMVVIKVLGVLAAAYPKEAAAYGEKTVTGALYIQMLSDIPEDLLLAAAHLHISRSTWFPLIAELRKCALEIQEAIDPVPDAWSAWSEVRTQMELVGRDREPTFSHPQIYEIVRRLSWRQLCMSEEPVAERSHFIRAWNAMEDERKAQLTRPQAVQALISAAQAKRLPEGTHEQE